MPAELSASMAATVPAVPPTPQIIVALINFRLDTQTDTCGGVMEVVEGTTAALAPSLCVALPVAASDFAELLHRASSNQPRACEWEECTREPNNI
jgi:hypothetical protein